MSGADIRMNTAFVWTLSAWETLLTHEIGHALGLADLEASPATSLVSGFLDDDYDPTSSATAPQRRRLPRSWLARATSPSAGCPAGEAPYSTMRLAALRRGSPRRRASS